MPELIRTNDGSDTLFHKELNEHYHSLHGALQESEHVYIKSGLNYYIEHHPECKEIKVFEVGMGTGLNVLLSIYWALKNNIKIHFTTIELYPLDWKVIEKFNFGKIGKEHSFNQFKELIHKCSFDEYHQVSDLFSFQKVQMSLEDIPSREEWKETFHVMFFDAFAPNKQEEMWTPGNLSNTYDVLANEGVWVTYCAKGEVRRRLQSVGYQVQRIPGPPGKREMLRALK